MMTFEQARPFSIAPDVLDGLGRTPKTLPPKLFYDQQGSALFEQITYLPEYYPTRTEAAILQAHADEICARSGCAVSVSELGAGTATKTRILLQALLRRQSRVNFYPLDVSHAALREAKMQLNADFEFVNVFPQVGDFTDLSFLGTTAPPRLVLYIGSSIGNLELDEAVSLLKSIAVQLCPGDHLLLGVDMVKSPDILVAAYDDDAGITAAFNKNLLARINRELDGNFDLEAFQHVALWNKTQSCIEMYLESKRLQHVDIGVLNKTFSFFQGERIHTENSFKYTMPHLYNLLERGGFEVEQIWTDPRQWFAVSLGVIR